MPPGGKYALKNVTYSLPNNESLIDGINICAEDKYAIVGLSGEGKTTLVDLLLGSRTPSSGQVLIFGESKQTRLSKGTCLSLWRYYSQESSFFNEDLVFNISLGKKGLSQQEYFAQEKIYCETFFNLADKAKSGSSLSDKDVLFLSDFYKNLSSVFSFSKYSIIDFRETIKSIVCFKSTIYFLAKCSFAKDFYIIERMNSLVNELDILKLQGRKFGQHGSFISGGERARVCLARFLLPDTDQPYILDEPLEGLDVLSQKKLAEITKKYLNDSSGFVISHNLDIVRNLSNKIIVLENGRIDFKGTHEDALLKSELYKKLWNSFVEHEVKK